MFNPPGRRLRTLLSVAIVVLAPACRDRAPAPEDSTLAGDLAQAQRSLPAQAVFNDAPLASAAPAPSAPAQVSGSPARAPRPTPRARPHAPPAVVVRAPRQSATGSSPAVAAAPVPQPAPGPAPGSGIVGAGTRIGMSTNERVCARGLLVGDKFTASVTGEIAGTNGVVIPSGATVVLEVAAVERADPVQTSRIHFRVRSIDVNGVAQPAEGDVATLAALQAVQSPAGGARTKVVGGAVAGAVLGRILGGGTGATVIGAAAGAAAGTAASRASSTSDACLPGGSALQLTLSRGLAVRRAGAI